MSLVVMRGARHRGRVVSSRDAEWVREVLTSAGFGWKGKPGQVTRTRLQVWSSPEALPADWAPEARSPIADAAPGYSTYWFEADYQQDAPYVVLGDTKGYGELLPSWKCADIGPYCWLEPDIYPPGGMQWCPGVVPAPQPVVPSIPPTTPNIEIPTQVVESPPERKSSTSTWVIAFAIAIPLVAGAVIMGRSIANATASRRALA